MPIGIFEMVSIGAHRAYIPQPIWIPTLMTREPRKYIDSAKDAGMEMDNNLSVPTKIGSQNLHTRGRSTCTAIALRFLFIYSSPWKLKVAPVYNITANICKHTHTHTRSQIKLNGGPFF